MKAAPILLSVLLIVGTAGAGAFVPDANGAQPAVDADDAPLYDGAVVGVGAETRQLESDNENATRVLGIPDDEVDSSEVRREHADIGPAVGFGANATGVKLGTDAMERQLEAIEETDERQRQILAEISEIEQQEITLNGRERAAVEAYGAGEIDARELVVRLARVSMEAQLLRERLAMLREQADETPDFSVDARANNIDFQLRTYGGPVRDHAKGILEGEHSSERVFVESGGDAVVLSMIHDGEYVREAKVPDRLDRSTTGSMDLEGAERVTFGSYPEIAATRQGADSIGSDGIFIVQVPHAGGELTTFVDGGSEQVFIDHQRIPLENTTGHVPVADVQEGLNVTVDRSYPGGPVRVTVLDAETDDPVIGATVTVGDAVRSETVGTTDVDGQQWIVSPREPFLLTVLGEDTTVARLEIQPTETPHIEEYTLENETETE
ncbi:Secreted protein, component of type IV pili likesystem [Halalkaliarchaeum sp. AArc-CO]|uniref:DUF7096 domain-containing protein n=1 Tax=Halalkaliarchaeum sp. AArc-CO TaxID=2866381 RepID=UPI00217CFB84|nr:hypothetical protein [Halalkaliarchaeum sp. AArc-CO]UWG51921.1 Secreted protein, component of type IV pili likesystem [Halalkaliarchaeum sp. AArc-CO]